MQSSIPVETSKRLPSAMKVRLIRSKKLTKQEYVGTLNKILLHRIEIGYRQDTVLQLQQEYISEVKRYSTSNVICLEQAQNLEKFVAEDYKKSMDLLKASDQLKLRTERQNLKYLYAASKVYTIKCELNILDARYRVLKQYHQFLIMLSPAHWREQFDETSQMGRSDISSNSDVQKYSFTNIANYVYNDLTIRSKPQLYFKNAMEIENVFTIMVNQNYNYFRHLEQMSSQSNKLKECMREFERDICFDRSLIQDTMEYLGKIIQYDKEKADGLRDIFFSNVHSGANVFDLLSSKKVLRLSAAVEYCYETVMGESCGSFTILDMIKELEIDFLNICRYLDGLDNKVIAECVKDSCSPDARQMKQAVVAAKELKSMSILTKSMCRIMDPPVKPERSKKERSYLPNMKKKRTKEVELITNLTPSDVQYLTLFTDWTKNDDPETFLAAKKYLQFIC